MTTIDTDPLTGIMYGVAARQVDSVFVLLTIDPATGLGTEIGPTCFDDRIEDLTFEPGTNRMLGLLRTSVGDEEMVEFNRMTGQAVVVGNFLTGGGGPTLEYVRNGELFATFTSSGVPRLYEVNPTTGEGFGEQIITYPPGYTNVPFMTEMERSILFPDPHVLFRDNSSGMRFGIIRTYGSPPIIEFIDNANGAFEALSWHPGAETVIATGEVNDGSYLWTVPDDPTNYARIKITAVDSDGVERFDYTDGRFYIINTTEAEVADRQGTFLAPPSPNPSSGETSVRFRLSQTGKVALQVFDVRGRLVASLAEGSMKAGEHVVQWNGRDLGGAAVPPGQYMIQLRTDQGSWSRRVSFVR